MDCTIKKEIRRRKGLYRKAERSNNASHWTTFKPFMNQVISCIGQSKENHYAWLSLKLKSCNLFSREGWKTIKSMIFPHTVIPFPPFFNVSTDSLIVGVLKANILNVYFANQSCIHDDSFSNIPDERFHFIHDTLDTIKIMSSEKLDFLNHFPT